MIYDVAVIGSGAAGMAAAVKAAERSRTVILFEKADRPGRKILASGNGRCNLMNRKEPRYFGDPAFADRILNRITPDELTVFFSKYGLILKEEDEGRIYPVTFQALSVVAVLKNAILLNAVTIKLKTAVKEIRKHQSGFEIRTVSGDLYYSGKVIVTCGGAAQPKLGGSQDGYHILQSFGHTMIPFAPALVPLTTDQKSISGLSGLRVQCPVRLVRNDRIIHTEEGEVLFTDYGISGICVMQCARFAGGSDSYILLDLLKNIFPDKTSALTEFRRRKNLFASCSPIWILNGIIPEKMAFAVLKQAGVPMCGEKAGEIDDGKLNHIAETAGSYRIKITGNRGLEHAQVTAGGADCSQFNPESMESRIITGLYAAGEVLNVDGDCGGFNLMFAFASGLLAGGSV